MAYPSNESVSGDQLRAFIERVERMQEERKAISDDIAEIYAEAKGFGFDTKVMRQVVRIRAQDQSERFEQEAILELYMTALGMRVAPVDDDFDEPRAPARARARENIEESGATNGDSDQSTAARMDGHGLKVSGSTPAGPDARMQAGRAAAATTSMPTPPSDQAELGAGTQAPPVDTNPVTPGGPAAEGAEPPSPQQASSADTNSPVVAEGQRSTQVADVGGDGGAALQGGAEVARLAHNQEVEGAIPSPATSAEAHQEGAADGESPSPDPAEETGHHAGGENVAAPSKAGEVDATSSVIAFAPKPYDGPVDSKGLPRPHGCRDLDRCHSSTWREPCHGCKTAAQQGQVA